ncbi:hypothetical protein JXM83_05445, partial [Candidatus Woesearchaeota archaeon]|nr:hypothetical protein [Candidatus Woesearchaeota archaeon]
DFVLKNIDNPIQKIFLEEVVQKIKEKSSSSEQQAKIAILMVQGIPYDDYAAESNNIDARYAYEVLYDMKGVCMEKSDLLAYLLRELGFGVAIFEFENEEHRAVGIKCNDGNYNSQYCFIESTDYFPIGKIPTDYVGNVNIKNANPEIIIISDGKTFEN